MPRMRLFKFVGKVLPLGALIVGVVWAALHDQKFLSGCASREPKNGSGDRVRQRRPAACSWGHHCDALGITAGRARHRRICARFFGDRLVWREV
jgi:hypothetical protein